MNTQIFIAAGGKGTRLGNITKNIPKSMVRVAGKPIIEHIINSAIKAKIEQIVIAIDSGKEALEEYVQKRHSNIDFERNCFEPLIKGFLNSCKVRCPRIIIGVNGDTIYSHESIFKTIELIASDDNADGALLLTSVKKPVMTSDWIYWKHEISNRILVDMSETHGHHINSEYVMSAFKYSSLMKMSDNFTNDLSCYEYMPFNCYSLGWDYILRIALWKKLKIVTLISDDLSLNINYPSDIEEGEYFFSNPDYFRKTRSGKMKKA